MKIIFLNRYFYPDLSATSQLLSDLAFYLAGHQYAVHVITSRQRYDDAKAYLLPHEQIHAVTIHRVWTTDFGRHFLPGRLLDYLTFYLCSSWRLYCLCRKGDIVVVKTDPPMLSIPVALIARLCKIKQVNWLQDLFPEVAMGLNMTGINKLSGGFLKTIRNRSLCTSVMNVVVGEDMRDQLLKQDIPASRITVIHNWADDVNINPVVRTEDPLVREWGLPDNFVVGYSGNLGRGHEYKTILAAAEKLKENKNIIFLFVGGGACLDRMREEQQELGIDNIMYKLYQSREKLRFSLGVPHVHLITLRPEMTGLMLPSKFYGIAAAGRPAIFIGDTQGEIPRLLKEADCGISITTNAVDELVKLLTSMQSSPERLEQMGRNARKIYEERYSSRRAFRQWKSLLAGVLTGTA